MKRAWIDFKWMVRKNPVGFAMVILSFVTAAGVTWLIIK